VAKTLNRLHTLFRKPVGNKTRVASLARSHYESFSPQFPQNFVPGGLVDLHFEQVISLCSDTSGMGLPQLPQNLLLAGFCALQLGQATIGAGSMLVPQFPQNFIPAVFLAPHFGQTTTSCGFPA
jgi:hypothetical protein